jgi:hypothetical protein
MNPDTRRLDLDHPPLEDAATKAHRDMTRIRIKIAHRIASLRLLEAETPKDVASRGGAEAEGSHLPSNTEGFTGGLGLEERRRDPHHHDDDDEEDDADSQHGDVPNLEPFLRSWWRDLVRLARAFPEQALSSRRDAVSVLYLAQMAAVDKVREAETYTRQMQTERDEIRVRRRSSVGTSPRLEGRERSFDLFKTPEEQKNTRAASSSSSSSSSDDDSDDDFTVQNHFIRENRDDEGRLLWAVPEPVDPTRVADRMVEAAVVALDQATSDLVEANARLDCVVEAVNHESTAEIQLANEAKVAAVEAKNRAREKARAEKKRRRARETFESLKRSGGVRAMKERYEATIDRKEDEEKAEEVKEDGGRWTIEDGRWRNKEPEGAKEATRLLGEATRLLAAPAPAPPPALASPPVLASLSADQPPVKRKRGRPRKKVALIGSLESPEPPTPVNKVESQLHLVSENQLDRDLKDWWKENPEASVKVDMNVGASGLSVAICSPL